MLVVVERERTPVLSHHPSIFFFFLRKSSFINQKCVRASWKIVFFIVRAALSTQFSSIPICRPSGPHHQRGGKSDGTRSILAHLEHTIHLSWPSNSPPPPLPAPPPFGCCRPAGRCRLAATGPPGGVLRTLCHNSFLHGARRCSCSLQVHLRSVPEISCFL